MKSTTVRPVAALQDRFISLLGSNPSQRSVLVASMLRRDASEATSYWLQLLVSVGIATLGLVVGSTAVVIGAMLVAPLMGPIIAVAMGLATGSPFLVMRSAGRIGLSVLTAVGGAALITLLLPFHELNAEINARTSPTVLDLVTAGFCAMAGVYATLRGGSDTATTAAGTSISISLVPPLCASGYGIGTQSLPVSGGAALLFLTNLVAIVVVGTVAFLAGGFNRVNVLALERAELDEGQDAPVSRAVARRLSSVFASRLGPALRFLMPFALLAAVYVPLRRALDEVAWQVRVRASVQDALAHVNIPVVQSRIRVERHAIEGVVVVLGKASEAEQMRAQLNRQLRDVGGVAPAIEVLAIPDATAFAGLESTLLTPRTVPAQIVTPPSASRQVEAGRANVRSVISGLWPRGAAGEPLSITVETLGEDEASPLSVRVTHLGAALSADALEMLTRAGSEQLERELKLVDSAIPVTLLTASEGEVPFLAQAAATLTLAQSVPGLQTCVTRPAVLSKAKPGSGGPKAVQAELRESLAAWLQAQPGVALTDGEAWSLRIVRGTCTEEH